MSDPLNPPCVACSVKPAQYGKPLCTDCQNEADAAEKRDRRTVDHDAGDEHVQRVS